MTSYNFTLREEDRLVLEAQEIHMRGYVAFSRTRGTPDLTSSRVIPIKKAGSILGDVDEGDDPIFRELGELREEFVPYYVSSEPGINGENFSDVKDWYKGTLGMIRFHIMVHSGNVDLFRFTDKDGVMGSVPLEFRLQPSESGTQ